MTGHAGSPDSRRRYVVIASTPYSGSTMLAMLLGSHPGVATVAEVSGNRRQGRMAEFRCACGRLMLECPFWLQVRTRMQHAGYSDFDLGNFGLRFDHGRGALGRFRTGSLRWSRLEDLRDAALNLIPGQRRSLEQLAQRNLDFARTVLDLMGGEVFVDTSKERMRIRYLYRQVDMDVRAVHLVRDVRAVTASTLRRHPAAAPVRIARDWASTNSTIKRHLDLLPAAKRILVRYEDVVRDVDSSLSRLFAFCGLDQPGQSPFHGRELHLIGNAARLRSLGTLTLDERWRSVLDPTTVNKINSAAWRTMGQLYPEILLAES